MNRKIATKIEGWNTIEDISRKLKVRRSVAYKYIHYLNKEGFVVQKIRRPRGTMYEISPVPKSSKYLGFYENTELIAPEKEFSKKEITPEQKIAYFLFLYKKERNRRLYDIAGKLIKDIKNWKELYRYLKAYDTISDFAKAYAERRLIKKIPRMPDRYKKLIGVKNAV